jgi:hypothetical protein
MRKPATFLLLVVLMAFPALSWAQGEQTVNYSSGDVSASVQGYGDQAASYQTGCVQVETYEKATVDKVEVVVTGQYTNLGSQSGVPCSPCGTDVTQGKFEGNITTTRTLSEYTAVSKGSYFTGSSNMTSQGGLSLCATAGISAEASLSQAQTVNLDASGSLGPGMTGSASYTGTQSFTSTITSQ